MDPKMKDLIRETVASTVGDVIDSKLKDAQDTKQAPTFIPRGNKRFPVDQLSAKALDELTNDERGLLAGRCVRYVASCQGNLESAIAMAKAHGDKSIVEAWEKAMTSDVFASGGALVPPEFAAGIIDKLYATAVMRSLGVTVMPMNTGSLTMPFISTGASAAYVGQEGDNISKSELGTGQLQLSDKKLAALVPMSNDLLRNGGPAADRIVRDNMVRELRLVEDVAFIRYDGTSGKPKGLRYWAQTTFGASGGASPTAAQVAADLYQAMQSLEDLNVPLQGCAWAMAPRTKYLLASLLDGNNNYIYRDEIARGELLGYPLGVTTQIPKNLGTGSDESEIYFFNAPLCVIAENENLMLEAFPGGAYYDGSAVQSGISRDETPIRAIALHDFGCQQRGQEVAVITGVQWTA